MAQVIGFALATTTLNTLLGIFEEFCDLIQSLAKTRIKSNRMGNMVVIPMDEEPSIRLQETKIVLNRQGAEIRMRHLREEFHKVQSLFQTYNELLRPIILSILLMCTCGTIDVLAWRILQSQTRNLWLPFSRSSRYHKLWSTASSWLSLSLVIIQRKW